MKIEVKDLLASGAHFGHKSEKWNPKMSSFIFGKKAGIHIIDLEKTQKKLEEALDFIAKEAKEGKTVLFVGTKRQAQDIIREEAKRCNMPYVEKRWLGGTLTNFTTIIGQVKKMVSLREDKEKGALEKFSKKEQAVMKKELVRLEEAIGGLESLKELPDVLFIVDIIKEDIAVKEAKKAGLKIVAVTDTNTNPEDVDYPIPANDDAVKSIKFITSKVSDAILGGAKDIKTEKEEVEDKKESKE
jgi:small subunit ribosomal protein S2